MDIAFTVFCTGIALLLLVMIVGFLTGGDDEKPEEDGPSEIEVRQALVHQLMSQQPPVYGMTTQGEIEVLAKYEEYILYGAPEEE